MFPLVVSDLKYVAKYVLIRNTWLTPPRITYFRSLLVVGCAYLDKECDGIASVDETVVVCQCHSHDRTCADVAVL